MSDLKNLPTVSVNAYLDIINQTIASTQNRAKKAIDSLQRKKNLEERKRVLEGIRRNIASAPAELKKERTQAERRIVKTGEPEKFPSLSTRSRTTARPVPVT